MFIGGSRLIAVSGLQCLSKVCHALGPRCKLQAHVISIAAEYKRTNSNSLQSSKHGVRHESRLSWLMVLIVDKTLNKRASSM